DHARATMSPAPYLGAGADRDDPRPFDGERGCGRTSRVEREDAAVDEERVRGYLTAPSAGATSPRKRANCPRWSQDASRSAMWPTPASKYAFRSAMHCFGLPVTVQPSTNVGLNFDV